MHLLTCADCQMRSKSGRQALQSMIEGRAEPPCLPLSLLPSNEKRRKRTADTKCSDDGKNNRRISRMVHAASHLRLPKRRTRILYKLRRPAAVPERRRPKMSRPKCPGRGRLSTNRLPTASETKMTRLPGSRAGFTEEDVPAEDKAVSLVYLTSGAGGPAENTRWNTARSALGRSETAT